MLWSEETGTDTDRDGNTASLHDQETDMNIIIIKNNDDSIVQAYT